MTEEQIHAAPLTEEEAARIKGKGPADDEDPDAVKQIGSVNPIEDFKKMINDRKTDRVSPAMRQMQAIIERFIRSSLKGDLYDKAFECLETMRQGAIQEDEAPQFNAFMQRIKEELHRGFFEQMIKRKLSLITKEESQLSSVVTKEEAKEFLSLVRLEKTTKPEEKAKD